MTALGLIFGLALAVAWLGETGGGSLSGRARLVDGDTLEIGGRRVRLSGIDAPEYRQTCRRDGAPYPCGEAARAALGRLIAGREVTCELGGRDRYRRHLARCTSVGTDLNRAMVLSGHAVSHDGYRLEEARARAAGAGIWAGEFERPEAWRAEHEGRMPRFTFDRVFDSLADGWLALRRLAGFPAG
ncbi:endonuclease YncB(thermonuclease family) [Hoeflea marina]|uniref:Endonuclease YncB(Thermonuclease family) n=1 Tax=Hoeflea marina TaxID=274592 RepID=A0A317PW50_9HYPH|nr:thermonuclease family protein [Hoeflea marina]PWW04516.1 endonuclease YncB(thermonuclease family) [Hoeflea marina]